MLDNQINAHYAKFYQAAQYLKADDFRDDLPTIA